MMTRNDILENNWLFRYLIGETSHEESLAIEEWISTDEEIKKMYEELELQMEHLALENAIPPPSHIKEKLIESIALDKSPKKSSGIKQTIWQGIAAGLIILLGGTAFYLFYQFENLQDDIELVIEENKQLIDTNNKLIDELSIQNNWYALLTEPATQKYVLRGNERAPSALVVGYINHQEEKVVLNAQNLPDLAENKDLQLWADVEGEMINMGVIPKGEKFIAMTYIPNAESFNITIEPAGGSTHPTVSDLIASVRL